MSHGGSLPTSVRKQVSPTISAAAYSSGNVMGGIMTFADVYHKALSGVLKDIVIKDAGNQKPPLTILLFSQLPTGTYTDRAAFAWGGSDFSNLIGKINVAAADYETVNGKAIAHLEVSKEIQSVAGVNALYAIAVTTGTPTPASTSDLTFQVGVLQD